LENYSGILVFDAQDNLIADGWMDFIDCDNLFAYWDIVTCWEGTNKLNEKLEFGTPKHVLDRINKTKNEL